MNPNQFAAIMPYISADLVGMIAEKENISENAAITKLYNSELYAILEQEDTKVWHYSTHMLYSLLEKEEKTGNGQQLLKEPMEIVLPMVLTEQDVEKLKIDKSQLVYDENQQVFKMYDRIFEISNSGNLVLPMTGGDGLGLSDILFLAAALLLMIGVCLFVYRKGKTTAQ